MIFYMFVSLLIIFFITSKMISQPIINLTEHIKQISDKNLDLQLEVFGNNEISQLAHSFNDMSLRLKNTIISKTDIEIKNLELKEENTRDWLTKLYNKKHISNSLRDSQKKSIMNNTELSVILYDIDHFKIVNDEYGHLVGDIVLRELSAVIEKNLGNDGIVGRYGGEEFLSVLPNKTLQESWDIFEKTRQNIESLSFSSSKIKLTISAGLASIRNNENKNLVSIADKNLYIAKNSGRNQGIK